MRRGSLVLHEQPRRLQPPIPRRVKERRPSILIRLRHVRGHLQEQLDTLLGPPIAGCRCPSRHHQRGYPTQVASSDVSPHAQRLAQGFHVTSPRAFIQEILTLLSSCHNISKFLLVAIILDGWACLRLGWWVCFQYLGLLQGTADLVDCIRGFARWAVSSLPLSGHRVPRRLRRQRISAGGNIGLKVGRGDGLFPSACPLLGAALALRRRWLPHTIALPRHLQRPW
mmetsp:Transcript_56603/g.130071  ORF Transcript_56603/g.130071 Transcript_56603/m.130071 type:complete len:226 (+) Transcript_56603:627-1304(+)